MQNVLPNSPGRHLRQASFVAAFLVVVILFVTTFCMGVVRGASMEPTYQDGQVVLVRRHNLLNQTLHHNDVVLLQRERGEVIIKRIYRLPGEEVTTSYPFLIRPADPRATKDYYEQLTTPSPQGPLTRYFVPRGYIAVLGDNPDVSEDSRFFGPVPISEVIGTVVDAPPQPAGLDRRTEPPAPTGSAGPAPGAGPIRPRLALPWAHWRVL